MQERLNYVKTEPKLLGAIFNLKKAVNESGLDQGLIHLVNLRASQINGCSYCVDMHTREARRDGESEQRVHLVSAWRESPLYTGRERAALAWTERLTHISDGPVEDALYNEMLEHFSEQELVQLTVLVGLINVWNRIAIPFRSVHPVIADDASAAA
ncbi:carboxymuconolactone decarboxylase family protein [Nitratireductor aquimarinus]|uniref:carboxymuconolactone decarboxylase family protein n=1 Tax=Alphaproteobacteria TaxID=28211 RepID=UPI0019D34C22|nr:MULTISPECIES: carboxymuconolactone decarboxylase family protein [Alphaproteobacteria]MBY6022260.1 carboxymuconolactone decarboxylase family protein [Nitratireductor sp. DP7N14-4]MBN7757471.1 carboxymuconolactone decarboxylase family protein [Nitratireductor aquimarinus]MBN7774862.1 carboxymuconolactone decarboxylase family protein [Nitratireductor pacificus]MBN7779723.1 carboxymuconolactone decarboxylase family protein [Nitratireductor pacificus]MBN7788530.1 carboxymuconolactone decarboxyla